MAKYLKLLNRFSGKEQESPLKACSSFATDICGTDPDGCGGWAKDCCAYSDGGTCGIGSFDCTDADGQP